MWSRHIHRHTKTKVNICYLGVVHCTFYVDYQGIICSLKSLRQYFHLSVEQFFTNLILVVKLKSDVFTFKYFVFRRMEKTDKRKEEPMSLHSLYVFRSNDVDIANGSLKTKPRSEKISTMLYQLNKLSCYVQYLKHTSLL
jgi:hypothetical protein